jgi:starch phosphorylase
MNGAINLSILDGWWDEAFDEASGFKIGNGEEYENYEHQDHLEAEYLYNSLENEVIPLFYQLNEIGLPDNWIVKLKNSIKMAVEGFSSHRMIVDYTEKFYLPAIKSSLNLSNDNFELTRDISVWFKKIKEHWSNINITELIFPEIDLNLHVGNTIPVTVKVNIEELTPDDISVEIVAGQFDSHEEFSNYEIVSPELISSSDNEFIYKTEITCRDSGNFGITARVLPKNNNLYHNKKPNLITWW